MRLLRMNVEKKRVLVLNCDFLPMSVIDWRRALTLYYKNAENPKIGVEVIEYYQGAVARDSKGRSHPIPAVVKSAEYIKPRKNGPAFSRKNVFIRDQLTCQYCGQQHKPEELTFDHVTPRCKWDNSKHGTPTRWENIVTCCVSCNKKKADKTLKQAGMRLLREPKRPTPHTFVLGLSPWSKIEPEWKPYLPPIYVNCDEA